MENHVNSLEYHLEELRKADIEVQTVFSKAIRTSGLSGESRFALLELQNAFLNYQVHNELCFRSIAEDLKDRDKKSKKFWKK